MSFWSRIADLFREPKPAHPAILALRARRDAYVSFVRETAVTKSVLDAASERSEELARAAALWERRAAGPLPDYLSTSVRTLAKRLRASQEAAAAVAANAAESLAEAEETIATMCDDDLRLMRRARDIGLSVKDLTVEIDIGDLRRQADRRLLDALAAGGALEPDTDREFLEKLFEGLELRQPASLHS
jgi:hypothetical protein